MQQQPTPAVLYAAKSTEDKKGSIGTQLADARKMAEREGWNVIGEYSDEAASGWKGNRGPQLRAAMEQAEMIAPSVLVVQHTDRLARGDAVQARHLIEVVLWAIKSEVQIRSVQDDSTCENLIMAAVMGERNAEDSRRKSLAVKAGMKRRREAGKHHGGPRPYGYRYQGEKLVPVKAEAAIVHRIFAEYVAGASQLSISRNLHQDRVPTLRGGKWHQGTVRMILTNPLHAGMLRDGDQLLDAAHEPIIEMKVWRQTEALRAHRAHTQGTGRPPAGSHLFRKGMLRCGECGEAMVPRSSPNRASAPSEVYRCYGRHRDKDSCSMQPLPRAEIDTAVYRYFEQVGLDVEATRRAISEARDRKAAEVRALREQAEQEARLAQDRLARVRRAFQDGKIEAEDWTEQRSQLEDEQDAAQAEAERLIASEQDAATGSDQVDAETETLRRLSEIRKAIAGEINDAAGIDAVRAALSRLFEGFVVYRGLPERAHVELIGKVWIKPTIRPQELELDGEAVVPELREPLRQAENKYAVTLTR